MQKCGRGLVAGCIALLVGGAVPAHAWNDFGHELIARIAWQELEPEVREAASWRCFGRHPGTA